MPICGIETSAEKARIRRLYELQARQNTALEIKQAELFNEGEQAKANIAVAQKEVEDYNLWQELIAKVSNPETIDYAFLKKYGFLFFIFFLALWYFTKGFYGRDKK